MIVSLTLNRTTIAAIGSGHEYVIREAIQQVNLFEKKGLRTKSFSDLQRRLLNNSFGNALMDKRPQSTSATQYLSEVIEDNVDATRPTQDRIMDISFRNDLAVSHIHRKNYAKAEQILLSAKIDDEVAEHLGYASFVLSNLGLLYFMQGKYDKAVDTLDKALDIDIDEYLCGDMIEAMIMSNMGLVLACENDVENSLEWFEGAQDGFAIDIEFEENRVNRVAAVAKLALGVQYQRTIAAIKTNHGNSIIRSCKSIDDIHKAKSLARDAFEASNYYVFNVWDCLYESRIPEAWLLGAASPTPELAAKYYEIASKEPGAPALLSHISENTVKRLRNENSANTRKDRVKIDNTDLKSHFVVRYDSPVAPIWLQYKPIFFNGMYQKLMLMESDKDVVNSAYVFTGDISKSGLIKNIRGVY